MSAKKVHTQIGLQIMNIKSWFCKHEWKHKHNLFLALNDDWPCKSQHVEKCVKCDKERVITTIIGAGK